VRLVVAGRVEEETPHHQLLDDLDHVGGHRRGVDHHVCTHHGGGRSTHRPHRHGATTELDRVLDVRRAIERDM